MHQEETTFQTHAVASYSDEPKIAQNCNFVRSEAKLVIFEEGREEKNLLFFLALQKLYKINILYNLGEIIR